MTIMVRGVICTLHFDISGFAVKLKGTHLYLYYAGWHRSVAKLGFPHSRPYAFSSSPDSVV